MLAVGTLAATAALGAAIAADAQVALTQYGGALVHGRRAGGVTIGLTRAADGTVAARFGFAVRCRGVLWQDMVIEASGKASGTTFRVSGHTRAGRTKLTMTASGTFAGNAVSGHLTARGRRCDELERVPFRLRAAAPAAGPPAVPARGTVMFGVTSQSAGAVRLPVVVWVGRNGRISGTWEALASCARGRIPVMNVEPLTKVRADGSFSRTERYVVKYTDGTHDTFHVTFAGRFQSAGASGTLTARVQLSDPKHHKRFAPCTTGPQTWTATP
jgi:hypothetical protein